MSDTSYELVPAKRKRGRPRKDEVIEKTVAIGRKFVPRFWTGQDQRNKIVRLIRRRIRELGEDSGADSVQKKLLVQRAVFLSVRLEEMEVTAATTGEFSPAFYSQLANTFLGLLRALGLEKKVKAMGLKTYIEGK